MSKLRRLYKRQQSYKFGPHAGIVYGNKQIFAKFLFEFPKAKAQVLRSSFRPSSFSTSPYYIYLSSLISFLTLSLPFQFLLQAVQVIS